MPVTTRIITAASGSSRNARSSEKSPEVIHVKRRSSITRASASMPNKRHTAITETAKDASSARHAMPPEIVFERRFPSAALTMNPTSGNAGISDSTRSPLERRKRFRIERLAVPEEADDERESNRGFGRGHRHHEEGDDLSIHSSKLPSEGHKCQVHRVQHDLDREQQRDEIAPEKHAGGADREQHPGEDQIVTERHHLTSLLSRAGAPESRRRAW